MAVLTPNLMIYRINIDNSNVLTLFVTIVIVPLRLNYFPQNTTHVL